MLIVLWKNVFCLRADSFGGFTHPTLATDIEKATSHLKVGTLQNGHFPSTNLKNFGGANYTANRTKGR